MESYGSKVNYFCVGLGIGALAGILFAPKSGVETRDEMAQKLEEGKAEAEDIVEVPTRLKESISGAFEAGRQAYQQEMSKLG